MSRRIRLRLAMVLAAVGATLVFSVPTADAVGAPTSAWWSRVAQTTPTDESPVPLPAPAPAAPATVPVGASVPEGQLLVESTPDGAIAVAAIRWVLDEGDSGSSLTLSVAPGSTLNQTSIVLACKASAPWAAPEASPGTWDTKPLVDPSRCVNGVLADDAGSVSFGLQPLASGSDLDIVLVPGKNAEAGAVQAPVDVDSSTFRWLFDAPDGDSLRVVADSGFSEGDGDQFVTPEPTDTGFGAESAPAVDLPPTDFAEPAPSFEPPADPVAAAAPALSPEELAPTVPDVRRSVPAAAVSDGADRTIGFVLLLLAGLMAAWSYWTADEEPGTIGLGRFARPAPAAVPAAVAASGEPTIGGLSRFTRTRSTPPTPLN